MGLGAKCGQPAIFQGPLSTHSGRLRDGDIQGFQRGSCVVNFDYWFSQSWVQLLCFILFAVITAKGLKTGSSRLVYRAYKRAEDPEIYWAAIATNGLAAAAMLWLFVDGFMR